MVRYLVTMYHTFEFDMPGEFNEEDAIQHCINAAEDQGDFIYTASFEVEEVGGDDQEVDE